MASNLLCPPLHLSSLLLIITILFLATSSPQSRVDAAVASAKNLIDVEKMMNMRKAVVKNRRANNWDSRAFSAMLPRGSVVPPSGPSSCHNAVPNSINFYCDESAKDP